MKRVALTAIALSLPCAAIAQTDYWSNTLQPFRAGYVLSGYLFGAASICGHTKEFIDASMIPLARMPPAPTSRDVIAVTKPWTLEGQENLAREVSAAGLTAACAHADKERRAVFGKNDPGPLPSEQPK